MNKLCGSSKANSGSAVITSDETSEAELRALPATTVALELIDVLNAAEMKCALGGALALGFWGVPRGTRDVDLNVFIDEHSYERLVLVLEEAGCRPDVTGSEWTDEHRRRFVERAEDGDVAIVYKDSVRVDVFVPSIDFYQEAERTIQSLPLPDGGSVKVISAEALSVFKLLFFRDKDLVDLRRLVARQSERLDHEYVRKQIVEMLGEQEQRLEAWDEIVRRHGSQ